MDADNEPRSRTDLFRTIKRMAMDPSNAQFMLAWLLADLTQDELERMVDATEEWDDTQTEEQGPVHRFFLDGLLVERFRTQRPLY